MRVLYASPLPTVSCHAYLLAARKKLFAGSVSEPPTSSQCTHPAEPFLLFLLSILQPCQVFPSRLLPSRQFPALDPKRLVTSKVPYLSPPQSLPHSASPSPPTHPLSVLCSPSSVTFQPCIGTILHWSQAVRLIVQPGPLE